jgi:uncharacterized repeat protein (TIGR03803 family)
MSCKKVLGVASAVLMIVIVLTLALAPAARAADKYKALHAFHVTDGANPDASLILDAAGNLYGTTYYGGAHRHGTVFKLVPSADGSWTESVLHSFNGSTHQEGPTASLIFDAAGNLYGTTLEGGDLQCLSLGCGTVFKLTPNADGSWTESVLHTFHGGDGELPRAGLIFDVAGSLYGTTQDGGAHKGGTVFKLTPNADGSWTETVLHSFNGSDGRVPLAGLIFDAAGDLYGTTAYGGNLSVCIRSGCGVVFKLAPNADGSWTESVLHEFNIRDGADPFAGVIFDAAGNLYGTTEGGGSQDSGTLFKLSPNADGSWTESVLHEFINSDGRDPYAGLIFDGAGNLYGTASVAGSPNGGAVFKLSPHRDGSWEYILLHVFEGRPAEDPVSGLVLGSAGTLYGTTLYCSSGCRGMVYQITP